MEQEIGTWDSVLLDSLSEDSFINNIHQRYKRDHIYTYIGTSVVALNPYHHISENTLENIKNYGSKGIFQLPPHIYGLSNLAFQALKDQNEDQCILLMGESGSGKTESYKMIVNFLTNIQEKTTSLAELQDLVRQQFSTSPTPKVNPRSTSQQVHRRASSSSSAQSFAICRNSSATSVNQTKEIKRRQSPSPGSTAKRCDASTSTSTRPLYVPHCARVPGVEKPIRRNVKTEKNVEFDFTRHKSSENVASLLEPTATEYIQIQPSTTTINTNERRPSRSCFKHPTQTQTQISSCTANTTKKACSNTSNVSPKYGHLSGCRQCGHSKCTRALSLDKDESELLSKASNTTQRLTPNYQAQPHRNSCSNLIRQQSTESQTDNFERASLVGSIQRMSLYDTTKLIKNTLGGSQVSLASTKLSSRLKTTSQKLRECVTFADVFLEAMGNATTLKNNNSSRYGKLVDIEIDFKGDPKGLHITHYMLEKTRVTETAMGERNFHIFYQLLAGADIQLLKSLKLYRNIERYEILRNSIAMDEDKTNFHYTKKSLNVLGLESDDINSIFRVIAAVLKLGNFVFVPMTNIDGTEGCQVSNVYEVQETAQLLDLDAQILINCLTRATCSLSTQEDVGCDLEARQAAAIRNTLCRSLYSRLFTWLVNKINEILKSTQREKNLALLDFYGFETLDINSFEQFAINYSAEKIHQTFVNNVLKMEQELYIREGLEWSRIDYFDNETICELIDKPSYGILSIINEPHLITNDALLQRIQQCCAGHTNFITSGSNSLCFSIRHFANVVHYSVNRFLEKNSDILPRYVSSSLYQSKLSLIQSLFPEGNPRRQSARKPSTLSSNIRTQLQTLMAIIKNRRSHYVFCIKPNECKQARTFDLALVQHQVRYMSLMPLVHLCRNGHCFHLSHAKFFQRYKLLNSITWPHFQSGSTIEGIALIIRDLPLPSAEFTIGTKNVFVRSPRTVYELEQFRKVRINDLAMLIQKTFRMFSARKSFLSQRNSQIVISSAWRTWRAKEEYRTVKYKKQVGWAVDVISRCYRHYKIRQYLLTIPLRLPPNTLSPLSSDWPAAPKFLSETSRLLRVIYHRWKCLLYRTSFDQTARNRMREKVTASIIFKDRKASYARSVGHPFTGDYVRLRQNIQWKKLCAETNDQYVVFADIINKITRSTGKVSPVLLVLSTSSLLLLDHRTLQIKYRVPASEIYRMSLSPYVDDIAVFHVKASEFGRKKGDFVFQTAHVIEIVTKMFLVIQNATGKPPEIHISTEFEANFGQQTVIFSFKYSGLSDLHQPHTKIVRRGNRMDIIV